MVDSGYRWGILWLLMLLGGGAVLAAQSLPANGPVIQAITISDPRPFGHRLGATVERRIDLIVDANYRLDRTRLPSRGRIDRWFFAWPVEVHSETLGERQHLEVVLRYQLINLAAGFEQLELPSLVLHWQSRRGALSTPIPGASLRVVQLSDPTRDDLRADRPAPMQRPIHPVWLLGPVIVGGAVWVRLLLGSRWLTRHLARDPFARAARQLKQMPGATGDDEKDYQHALSIVHDAFNSVAGRSIFAGQLDALYQKQPKLAASAQPIERFYTHSARMLFSASVPEVGESRYSMAALRALCLSLSERMRAVRDTRA